MPLNRFWHAIHQQTHAFLFTPGSAVLRLEHSIFYIFTLLVFFSFFFLFLPRDAMHKRGYCRHAVSVCLSVCHVRELRQNEWTYLRIFFTIRYPSHSSFSVPNGIAIFRRNPPNGGVECRWGIGRNRDSGLIPSYRRLSDVRSVKNIYRRIICVYDSRPRTTGYRSIVGRANYEVTKTVTDHHAVYIAQSATHRRMFVCDGLQHGRIRRTESINQSINQKRIRVTKVTNVTARPLLQC